MNPFDDSIPLLTEVIAAPVVAVPAMPTLATDPQSRQEIQEQLIQQLLGQMDSVLHQHLQAQFAVILDEFTDTLKTRLRASLEQALRDGVAQVPAQEMANPENSKY